MYKLMFCFIFDSIWRACEEKATTNMKEGGCFAYRMLVLSSWIMQG